MSEKGKTPTKTYGVCLGERESVLRYLFATREAAERYAEDYNRDDVARMNAYFDSKAAKAEAEGKVRRAGYYRGRRWKPSCRVVEHTIHAAPEQADPRLYERIAEKAST